MKIKLSKVSSNIIFHVPQSISHTSEQTRQVSKILTILHTFSFNVFKIVENS